MVHEAVAVAGLWFEAHFGDVLAQAGDVPSDAEEVIAEVTEIAYQALLRDGLQGPFIDVELRLWREIRDTYYRRLPNVQLAESA